MSQVIKTLLLLATSLSFTTSAAVAQAYIPPSLSAARRACAPPAPSLPRYIPGHYKVVMERVFIPGGSYQVFVPPRYETKCLGPFRSPVTRYIPGRYVLKREPARYEYQHKRVWVPGRYSF